MEWISKYQKLKLNSCGGNAAYKGKKGTWENSDFYQLGFAYYIKVGKFDPKEVNVGTGMVGAPACGDVMKLQIRIKGDHIEDACFKTYGCGSAIASSSLATEWIRGKTVDEALTIDNTQIVEELIITTSKNTLFGSCRRCNQISNSRL